MGSEMCIRDRLESAERPVDILTDTSTNRHQGTPGALKTGALPDPVQLTMTLGMSFHEAGEEGSAKRESFKRLGKLTRQTQGIQVQPLPPSAINTDLDKDPLQTRTDELEKEVQEVLRVVDCLCAHMDKAVSSALHKAMEQMRLSTAAHVKTQEELRERLASEVQISTALQMRLNQAQAKLGQVTSLESQLNDVHAVLEGNSNEIRALLGREETLLSENAELIQELQVLRQLQDAEAEAAASYARQLHLKGVSIITTNIAPTMTTPTIAPSIAPAIHTPTITPYDTLSPTTTATDMEEERQIVPEVSKTSQGVVTGDGGSGSCGVGLKLVWRPGAYRGTHIGTHT